MRFFFDKVRDKLIPNCPVSAQDVANSIMIYGPDLGGVRGKIVRQKPERENTEFIQIPRDFYILHKFVTLTADVMFVNGNPILVTMSQKNCIYMAEYLPLHTASQLGS